MNQAGRLSLPREATLDPMDPKTSFALALRSVRATLGLSQEELAARVALSTEAYGRLERGRVLPRVASLLRLAEETGLSVDALLGRGRGGLRGEVMTTLLGRASEEEQEFLLVVLRELRRVWAGSAKKGKQGKEPIGPTRR